MKLEHFVLVSFLLFLPIVWLLPVIADDAGLMKACDTAVFVFLVLQLAVLVSALNYL